jgi:hypothetical protein
MQKQKILPREESEISLFRRAFVARFLRDIANKVEKDGIVDFGVDENFIKFANEIPNRLLQFADIKARRKLKEIKKMEAKARAGVIITSSYHGKETREVRKIKNRIWNIIDERFEKPGENSIMIYSCPSNPPSSGYSGWSTQVDKTFLYCRSNGEKFEIGLKRIRTNSKGKKKVKDDRIIYETTIPKL